MWGQLEPVEKEEWKSQAATINNPTSSTIETETKEMSQDEAEAEDQ